jgi:hypothetical protein
VNCWVEPRAIDEFSGDTVIETSAAVLTVSVVEPDTEPKVAAIVVCPVPALVARPFVPGELLMVATAALFELQLTVVMMFCVLPSVYVPVAANCWVFPTGMVGTAGVTLIESNVAGVTVKIVEPLIDPEAAVMALCPVAALAAWPVLLIVATAGTELLQVAEPVISRVLPSV